MNWETIEIMGYAYYSKLGYRIFVSLVRGDGYDFIAVKNKEFIRVNVKVAGLKDKTNPNSWSISQASGFKPNCSWSQKTECDVFLVFLPHQNRFIELQGDFLSSGNSKSRRIPSELLN